MSISYTSASTGSRDKARFIQQQFPNLQTQPNHNILNAMNSGISPLLLASATLGKYIYFIFYLLKNNKVAKRYTEVEFIILGNTVATASGPVAANLAQQR